AAEQVINMAVVSPEPIKSSSQTIRAQALSVTNRAAKMRSKNEAGRETVRIVLSSDTAAFIEKFNFPADGEYVIRVKAASESPDSTVPVLAFRLDGKLIREIKVAAPFGKPEVYANTVKGTNGMHRVSFGFANPSPEPKAGEADPKLRKIDVLSIEIEGPIGGATRPLPDSTRKIVTDYPTAKATHRVAAEAVLRNFARKAYRRPVKPDEVTKLMKLYDVAYQQEKDFTAALKLPLKAVLVSPHFLYRVEGEPKAGEANYTLTEHELATRLSYFLWATLPDDELSKLADAGQLRKNLPAQVRRMLKDWKSQALTDHFAGQWLMLRNLRTSAPDTDIFQGFDENLRGAMIRETELYFQHIMREDRPITEFLDSQYTFLNERLAKHYGIKTVKGDEFRKVDLTDNRRGGILTHASVLTVTSNPTRTSPVKRGKWVLENLLGYSPPPPPPEVPELPAVKELKGTLRQQMEQHRANPNCTNCHAKLDPIGFALENFDGIGRWRDKDN
ncbi:MAG: DUF1592 domain-containing protein, partial [Gemmataceae bacterium]